MILDAENEQMILDAENEHMILDAENEQTILDAENEQMILDAEKFAEEDKAKPVEEEATEIKPDFRGIVLGFKSNGVMTDKIIDYTSEVGVDEIKSRQNNNFNDM